MLPLRRSRAWVVGALLLAGTALQAACGTGSSAEAPRERSQAIELARAGVYYDPAFLPGPSWSELRAQFPRATDAQLARRLAWELAASALPFSSSGALSIPLAISAPESESRALRATCGATLIAPSWVVTAGHCANAARLSGATLQMYRPTPALARSYEKATQLMGAWPRFAAPALTQDDGYDHDDFACEVVDTCFGALSGTLSRACSATDDVALLRCEGRPGDRYGFVNLDDGEPLVGREVLVHWKHEVLDPARLTFPAEFDAHYRVFVAGQPVQDNYHYFAQPLLPLRSHVWDLDDPPRFLGERYVDVHGCHGTSGSGVLVRVGATAEFRLTAPVSVGGSTLLKDTLCAKVDDPDAIDSYRGVDGLGIRWTKPSALLALSAKERAVDCRARASVPTDLDDAPFVPVTHRVATFFSHLACQVASFSRPGELQSDPALGPFPEVFLPLARGQAETIEGFTLAADSDYRVALFSTERAACASACGEVQLELAGQTLRGDNRPAQPSSLIGGLLHSDEEAPARVTLSAHGTERLIGGFTLLREGQVNAFDTPEDRLEAALYPLAEGAPRTPLPMRFVGDGRAGFAALLKRGERLGLLRQAIVAGQTWTVRMHSDSYEGLTCGLLDLTGEPQTASACAPLLRIDDSAGEEGRLGFYVELAEDAEPESVLVRYVALASGNARDGDADGVPDVLDNCPQLHNPAQASCAEGLDGGLAEDAAVAVDAAGEASFEAGAPDARAAEDASLADASDPAVALPEAGARDAADAEPTRADGPGEPLERDAGASLAPSDADGGESQPPLDSDTSSASAGERRPARGRRLSCGVAPSGSAGGPGFAFFAGLALTLRARLRRRSRGARARLA